jgi:hypothetical protein
MHDHAQAGRNFFYLGNKTGKPNMHNGALLEKVEIIKHVMPSAAAEAKTRSYFIATNPN